MEIRPIFIIGVEHSGTTILYRMLARHPDLAWLSQYSMRGGEIPKRTKIPLYSLINRTGARFLGTSWRKDYGLLTTILPNPYEGHATWDYILPNTKKFFTEQDYTDSSARKMISLLESECRSWKKSRILIKLPRLSRAILLLNRVFPEAAFIHIIRDGKAVALSNEHKFARSPWGPAVALRESAEYWKEMILHIGSAGKKISSRFTVIKYENFCDDVRGIMSSLLEFAALTDVGDSLTSLPATLSLTNERQYKKCSSEDMRLLNDILQFTLEEFGYTPFEIA